MLAILAGKLDPSAGTASDRSEDALTDAVFGAIRYLPYRRVLGAVLVAVGVQVDPETLDRARVDLWPSYQVPQLPGMRVEPDVVVTVGTTVVVFEAKYTSPFSLYPADEPAGSEPLHQLAAQFAALRAVTAARGWPDPVVVAVTVGAIPPTADLERAERSVRQLVPDAGEGRFRWLPWHRIATCIDTADGLAPHERRLAGDALRFMESREVREVFQHLDLAAFEQVATAQRTAIGQLYPQLRLFFDSFTAVLQAERIDYSIPTSKGMQFAGVSTSVSRPSEWARASVGVAYWPGRWPKRLGTWSKAPSILAFFDFYDPAFEVSLTIPSPNVVVAMANWQLHAARLAHELTTLHGYDVVVDSPDPTGPRLQIAAAQVHSAWLIDAFSRLSGTSRLRLRRRMRLDALTVQTARDLLLDLCEAAEKCPTLWTMTTASGQTERPVPTG
ncbi:hypothetical protein [Parafrankia sp. EUN1f]|uniref:hypothetical protein n=1 Tax=Parafrankia sp. EUN1f TaxID=102897 RepID=UPI0001C4714B|nr:hypothetical protein [Parafrankia sp. EUN1f]EFC79702.1 hypothetical protein FrEUN1fDRAFT_7172 [Parafrankia sp. EUN1f]